MYWLAKWQKPRELEVEYTNKVGNKLWSRVPEQEH